MEPELPYLLGACPRQDIPIVQQTERYIVKRLCDGAFPGYVFQFDSGRWGIEDERQVEVRNLIHQTIEGPTFPTRHEAALFVCMGNRAYQYFVSLRAPQERIEIRITPNFGKRRGCPNGQWVASLYHEDGTPAGSDCCSESLEDAKFKGVQKAHFMTSPEPTDEIRRISKEDWKQIEGC